MYDVTLIVVGRKTKHEISVPVWFVQNNGTLHFLPRHEVLTEWYRDLRVNPSIKVKIADHVFTGKANLHVEKS